ncbi:ankyrin repeat domain-containing protein [Phycisphaera mikurensis]|uniref:Uncharacterized protein n=1 Tax=Phycisphaera mikurensis (strain NBRC 102666 / KCTC 22515 / FYK2301M01) TaxID=1142394 RepID=I0IAS7_PHYMF|nr:ankyrin repeat domain-containing protein [Phycisphaera mikurensis]MBB6442659.1 ankyrin repeat protein [Phycisphaera mikurensis]BAM02365.1 hypothetical protein PSMK_02060 [Phycisphaera mikurensis NBRC 102666]
MDEQRLDAGAWVAAITGDDADAVARAVAAEPARARGFLTRDRPWGPERWMPLHLAADAGAARVLDALLAAGVSVEPRSQAPGAPLTRGRATPLHLAAAAGHAEAVLRLVAAGAEPDVLDAAGDRPLHLAARAGHADAVQALRMSDAALEARSGRGRTPLHEAIAGGSEDAALALLRAGADAAALCPKEPGKRTVRERAAAAGMERLLSALPPA